jgi:phosphatidylglycerophosphate synthase
MHTESDLVRGWRLLIDRVSKRSADFVERYIDPPIENWLVRTFCETAVTPNQVTLLSIAFALAGASLFYQGWFFLAVFFAWVAIVLDGVDGKLARVKLMTSLIGKLEQIAGFFSENAWYVALAARLARTHDPTAWKLGLLVTGCNVLDNVLNALFTAVKGRTLDEMAPFDQWFRLIGGCRGIYLLMLLLGFVLGTPVLALQAVLGWAVATLLTHAGRAAYHLLGRGQTST